MGNIIWFFKISKSVKTRILFFFVYIVKLSWAFSFNLLIFAYIVVFNVETVLENAKLVILEWLD